MLRGNFNETGGRQVNNDDFYILQDQLFKAIELQYQGNGAFIVQGCTVTGSAGNYSISAGLVYIDGKILQFNAVSSISSFPKYIHQATPVDQDNFALEQGGSAYKRTQYKAELVISSPSSGEYIIMTSTGGRNYNDVLATNFVRLSGNQNISGTKSFSSQIQGDISGNAATANTVVNGVYTTGNQTINGTKTFSSTIQGSISGNAATANNANNANTVTNGAYSNANNTFTGNNTFTNTITGNITGSASFATNASTVNNGVYTNTNNTLTGNNTFTNPITSTGCKTDNVALRFKLVNFGDWNMQTTSNLNYSWASLGIAFNKFVDVTGWINQDAIYGGVLQKFDNQSDGYFVANPSTGLGVYRQGSGAFNSFPFVATGYNRGYMLITYQA